MDDQVTAAMTARISEGHGSGFITGYVAVIEWCTSDGELLAVTLKDSVSPPWRHAGLLTAVSDVYAADAEEDVEED